MLHEPLTLSKTDEADMRELERQLGEKDALIKTLERTRPSDREAEKLRKELEKTKGQLAAKDGQLQQEVDMVKELSD